MVANKQLMHMCVCMQLMTQVSTKLLLPFFSFISLHKDAAAAAADDDDVNNLSSCVADALFPK